MDYGKFGNCLAGRLYAIRKDQKLNQEEFGKRIGVTRSAICNYEGGTRPIGEQIILAVCREFSINELWMRSGVGNPYNPPKNGIIDKLISEYKCSKFEGDFLKSYFQMNKEERASFVLCAYRLLSPFMKGLQGRNPFADYFDVTDADQGQFQLEQQKMPTPVSEGEQDGLEEFVRKHKKNLTAGQEQQILEMMQAMIAPQKQPLSKLTVDEKSPKK